MSLSRKEKAGTLPQRPKSEFGKQLLEKQKTRFSYGVGEKQFAKYAKSSSNASEPTQKLFQKLEYRLDNVLYRAGLAKTRLQARQIASHGHATVNGRRSTIPSMTLGEGDVVSVREGSLKSALFAGVDERMKATAVPAWLEAKPESREVKVIGAPVYVPVEQVFDLNAVFEFYSR